MQLKTSLRSIGFADNSIDELNFGLQYVLKETAFLLYTKRILPLTSFCSDNLDHCNR